MKINDKKKPLLQKLFYIVPITIWGFSMSSLALKVWKNSVNEDILLRVFVSTIINNVLIGVYYFALSIFAGVKLKHTVIAFLVCTLFTIMAFY